MALGSIVGTAFGKMAGKELKKLLGSGDQKSSKTDHDKIEKSRAELRSKAPGGKEGWTNQDNKAFQLYNSANRPRLKREQFEQLSPQVKKPYYDLAQVGQAPSSGSRAMAFTGDQFSGSSELQQSMGPKNAESGFGNFLSQLQNNLA